MRQGCKREMHERKRDGEGEGQEENGGRDERGEQ